MASEQIERRLPEEALSLCLLLALAGGFLDGYTYLARGGVFANAETGNMVLLGIRLLQGEYARAGAYLVSVLSFALGIWGAEAIRAALESRGGLRWRQTTLGMEIAAVTLVAFLPKELDMLANCMVAFTSAMQIESFRRVEGNPYASTMCTGDLRSGTEQLFHCWQRRDRKAGRNAVDYYGVIAVFIVGAASGVPAYEVLGLRACLVCSGLLLVSFVLLTVKAGRGKGDGGPR
ncbi:YoaK family protein [Vermiculatibacterium agrestimuris]|uniref:YoaK family protein n=1 Tax=Vermiculatibacterium agrestimuris TaxID=2941519 RepID=UPI00203DCF10|nr:YoaK family protein [Vermiculatibacterium agrestimuris]